MLQPIPCKQERHPAGGPGAFYLGRAQELLPFLIDSHAGQVQLIYLDPPFQTGDIFKMRIGGSTISHPAYADTLSTATYLDMMRTVLSGCHKLLHPSGSLYLHVDYRMSSHLRLLLDELFGERNFKNEIIWAYKSGGRSKRYYPRKHDTILFYGKSRKTYFDLSAVGVPRGPDRRNHMKRTLMPDGRIRYSIRSNGRLYHYYEDTPVYPDDVWADIEHLHQRDPERTGYATQKPESLLRRIILASSRPGDLVADLFSGSGTTAAVASKSGRGFLAADCSPFALYALRKRLLTMHQTQNMLEPFCPVEFYFPEMPAQAVVTAALEQGSVHTRCTIHTYAAQGGDKNLAYCALGQMQQGAFVPTATADAPTLPCKLQATALQAPVLHTMDLEGRQGFWKLSSPGQHA